MTVHLFLPLPLSVNALYKNTGKARAKSKRYKDWIAGAQWQLASQYKKSPLTGPLMLTLSIKEPDRRRRDLGNLEKCVSDLLTGVVYNDDSQIKILAMSFDETDSPVGTRVMIDKLNAPIARKFLDSFANRNSDNSENKRPDGGVKTLAKPTSNRPNHKEVNRG